MFDEKAICANCFRPLIGRDRCPHCHEPVQTIQDARCLPRFTVLKEQYLIGRVLGIGGFGITYAALDLTRNSRCAIKEYFPGELVERQAGGQSVLIKGSPKEYGDGLIRFYNEAKLLQTLASCPSVVRVYTFFYANDTAYMVMEFIEGGTLNKRAQEKGGKIPYREAYPYFINIALALSLAHSKGIIHRDVSPGNIIITPDGDSKLIDFGAARSMTMHDDYVMLKPSFAPPEQYVADGNQGPWTDVYALACTFYRVVTGTKVPDALSRKKNAAVPAMHTLEPSVPPHVSAAIEKAMSLEIRDRFACMDDLINQVADYDNYTRTRIESTPAKVPPGKAQTPFSRIQSAFGGRMNPYILWENCPRGAQKWRLHDGQPIQIGRMPGSCEIVIQDDPSVSRIHCKVTYWAASSSVTLEDISRNGILFANGFRSKTGETFQLLDDTKISIGCNNHVFKVVMK